MLSAVFLQLALTQRIEGAPLVPAVQSVEAAPSSPTEQRAEAARPASPVPLVSAVAERFDFYGRLDGHLAFTGHDVRVENNSSRIGVMVQQPVLERLTVLGGGEWRMSLGQGDTTYNISENPDTGLATFQTSQSEAFSTRLGYVGLRFDKFGTLTLGKQWGVYYDISSWTDWYTVFGAHGSSTYNAGTDGGRTGNGRADSALVYRVALGALRLGVQAQFLDSTSRKIDGFGGAAVYDFGMGIRAGLAYTYSFLQSPGVPVVGYDDKDSQALTGGVIFERAGWRIASVNTWTHNHEVVKTASAAVMYDTLGAELYVGRSFENLVTVYGGFDFAIPRSLDTRFVDPNYGTRDAIFGVRLLLDHKAASFVYLEGRTGTTRDVNGTRADDALMLGIRFNYSLRRALGLERLREPRFAP
ncbi:MAG TPA: porin [Polyangiaceae bacterium]|nr:porin [Polyangiaceae bacterium]